MRGEKKGFQYVPGSRGVDVCYVNDHVCLLLMNSRDGICEMYFHDQQLYLELLFCLLRK